MAATAGTASAGRLVAGPERGDEIGGVGEPSPRAPTPPAPRRAPSARSAPSAERDIARAEADRERLAVALVRDAADPAPGHHPPGTTIRPAPTASRPSD